MRKYLIALLMLISCSAWADWVYISESSNGGKFYIDPETIRKDGNMRKVWELQNYSSKDKYGVSSLKTRYEYDCKKERYQSLTISLHSETMARGTTIQVKTFPDGDWTDIAPNTIVDTILQIVCAR